MEKKQTSDILDIIFSGKNKAYGAYVLRKGYKRTLNTAVWTAIIFITLLTTYPLIYGLIKPKDSGITKHIKNVKVTDLANVDLGKKKEDAPPPQVEAPPIKTTVKFTVPVVKPDNMVADEFVPTQEQLKNVDPGKKTQEGNPQGVDESIYKVETKDNTAEKVTVEETEKVERKVFTYVEEMPSFPGGNEEMLSFVKANIEYPEIAKRAGVEGKVYVQFVVDRNGSISNVAVVKGIGAGCDEEAIRVIRKMPKWTPGKQNGAPVNVQVSIPIFFKLQ
jgi:protein TonB